MPILTLCKYPGCRKPVPLGAKYCEAHKAAGEARDAKFAADRERRRAERKGSSSARGYGYQWQRLRARILAAHPLCVECEKRGIIKLATDVDHIRRERQKFCVHGIIGARQSGASNEHEYQTQFS